MTLHRSEFSSDDLSVIISDLLVATADASDALVDGSVAEVLSLLRERLSMDVVFVSQFVDGRRVFRFVDAGRAASPVQVGDSDPLEQSFCKFVVEGRLPQAIPDMAALPPVDGLPQPPMRIGAHLSTPIVLKDGTVYGTLCCFSSSPNPALQQRELTQLRHCAQLVARKLELAAREPERPGAAEWTLQPLQR
ncbi:GAF domain-containing protein [Eleftheria terrae]|uniref:GAF domain-containing protein n=1 Tax=Eleftheria terrae TaxID=1597781 RepID=UPI00263AFC83|nr:GAF domain-containing protein [Eleftheria terrae]WKB52228.1 GAF domain-containing protein [Eleftheria terrae]